MEKTLVSGGVVSDSVIQKAYISFKLRRALISLHEISLRLLEETAESPTTEPTIPRGGRERSRNGGPTFESLDPNVVIILVVLLFALICAAFLNSIMRCVLRRSGGTRSLSEESQTVQGLDAKALATLPIHSYRGAQFEKLTDGNPVECSICLNDFVENEKVRLLPRCNHVFHIDCIDTWLLSHVSCPVCRDGVTDDPKPQSSAIIAVEEQSSSSVNSHPSPNNIRTELSQEAASTSNSRGDGTSSHVVLSSLVGGGGSGSSSGVLSTRRESGVRASLSSMFAPDNFMMLFTAANLRQARASSSSSV
ncbi:hypothetical protein R1flu_007279 [Riccia fluitans]|uniref:RING-type E3 ubiquitin transferase n=1 Tax=Riccia fluitans TaxID=41844 RepID=A0ABD1YZ89_9MARC